jgi:hypothetical protein
MPSRPAGGGLGLIVIAVLTAALAAGFVAGLVVAGTIYAGR